MRSTTLLGLALYAATTGLQAMAADQPALVQKVIGEASAPAKSVLASGTSFRTGARSQSELALRRGIVRVGEHAEIKTLPSGVALRKGVTLIASKPGSLRSTIEVRTTGYHLRVRGTAQVAFQPGRSLKVVAIEGEVTVALDSLTGEFETLKPGQLLIINPGDARLPEPVELDLNRLLATSGLVGGRFDALPSSTRVSTAAGAQAGSLAKGELNNTSLLLRGLSNSLELDTAHLAQQQIAETPDPATIEKNKLRVRSDLSNPEAVSGGKAFTFADGTNHSASVVDFTFARNDSNISRTQLLEVEMTYGPDAPPTLGGRVAATADLFGGADRELRFIQITRDPAQQALQITPGSEIFTPAGVALSLFPLYGANISGSKLTAGLASSSNEFLEISPGVGGVTIEDSSLLGGVVKINGGVAPASVLISATHLKADGPVRIGKVFSPASIVIRNSSDLRSIVSGISLLAQRAGISIDAAALIAQNGKITVDSFIRKQPDDTSGQVGPALVTLQNGTTMTARAIRIRGFAGAGDAVVIDNSALAADLIKLYAEGASTLRFKNNVSLKTPLAVLAGQTIQVDSGGTLKISGKAQIFTDTAKYNLPGFGTLEAKDGVTRQGFSAREPF